MPTDVYKQDIYNLLMGNKASVGMGRICTVDTYGVERDCTNSPLELEQIRDPELEWVYALKGSVTASDSYTIAKLRLYAGDSLWSETPVSQTSVSPGESRTVYYVFYPVVRGLVNLTYPGGSMRVSVWTMLGLSIGMELVQGYRYNDYPFAIKYVKVYYSPPDKPEEVYTMYTPATPQLLSDGRIRVQASTQLVQMLLRKVSVVTNVQYEIIEVKLYPPLSIPGGTLAVDLYLKPV